VRVLLIVIFLRRSNCSGCIEKAIQHWHTISCVKYWVDIFTDQAFSCHYDKKCQKIPCSVSLRYEVFNRLFAFMLERNKSTGKDYIFINKKKVDL
jgi:hypothetical protein